MMIRIAQVTRDEAPDWSTSDRRFVVDHEMEIVLVDDQFSYKVHCVTPYEKTYSEEQDVLEETVSFVAYIEERPAGEVCLSCNWNRYAYIEDLVVSQNFRRQGVATALVTHAIAWAQSNNLPGVMLETQNNNLAACKLYESCGFRLAGFDSNLYKGLNPATREAALFWYWHPKPGHQ